MIQFVSNLKTYERGSSMNVLSNFNSQESRHLLGFIGNLIHNPGDSLSARVTPTSRQVLKLTSGTTKYSATRYPNGTIVETRTIRPK